MVTTYGKFTSTPGQKIPLLEDFDTSELENLKQKLLYYYCHGKPSAKDLVNTIMQLRTFERISNVYFLASENRTFKIQELLEFMVKSGIPGAGNLDKKSLKELEERVKFAHVNRNLLSMFQVESKGLTYSRVLNNEKVSRLLIRFGFQVDTENEGRFFTPGGKAAGESSMALDKLRVFVRENKLENLHNEDETAFKLRLWGATSPAKLPTYTSPFVVGNIPEPHAVAAPAVAVAATTTSGRKDGILNAAPVSAMELSNEEGRAVATDAEHHNPVTEGSTGEAGLQVAPASENEYQRNDSAVGNYESNDVRNVVARDEVEPRHVSTAISRPVPSKTSAPNARRVSLEHIEPTTTLTVFFDKLDYTIHLYGALSQLQQQTLKKKVSVWESTQEAVGASVPVEVKTSVPAGYQQKMAVFLRLFMSLSSTEKTVLKANIESFE